MGQEKYLASRSESSRLRSQRTTAAALETVTHSPRAPFISIFPAPHGANLIPVYQHSTYDPCEILSKACPDEYTDCMEMIQSSFEAHDAPTMISTRNGFLDAVKRAYSGHHHLRIRPEDVWGAILTQFSFYVNANAEELRSMFVEHEGQKKLTLTYVGTRDTFDFARFAKDMGRLMQENVLDPELREWIVPAFSTTTPHDVVVASIIMMGTMKKYFSYKCQLTCGLPSVTLMGTKADYELILRRLDKLVTFGTETAEFCELLRPVIRRFVESFDHHSSFEIQDFWQRIYTSERGGSGPRAISGWITAFCFWDADGKRLAPNLTNSPGTPKPTRSIRGPEGRYPIPLKMDGVNYPSIKEDDIPSGFCTVPVELVDERGPEGKCKTTMVAGSVGISLTSSGEPTVTGEVGLDCMQPQTGWWMFETINQDEA